jgi:hypothetical protein
MVIFLKKLLFLFLLTSLFTEFFPLQFSFLISAEWQKKYDYESVRLNFKEPPIWYAPHTFWFWDAPLDSGLTASMAREMTRQRLNPGYTHPRHSGDPSQSFPSLSVQEWLSPLWFASFESALKEAERGGMTLGYCDEYWWPSGQAAGKVLENHPELRAKSLEWIRLEVNGPDIYLVPPSKFTVAGQLSEKNLLSAKTLRIIGKGAAFNWKVPDGKWIIYSYNQYYHPGVDGGKVNYLDPKLMEVFIPIAHEPYQKHFGERMGNSIPGVFVDNEGDYGWKMAWSDYLAERYRELKERDIETWLPLLTEKDEEGLWVKARYDWFDVVSDVYCNKFIGKLSQWLADRKMYTISNLWEESLMLQTRAVGDFMRAQRSVTLPGNDCLEMKSQQVHDFKETQSVCEFEDRPFMSELMGVAGWEQTPVQMKQTLNAVTAFGVTHTVPHGINLNRKLETIPYPADWFTENPYWRYLFLWTDFARRAAFVNRQGHLCADILLLNPLESVWALAEGYFTSEDGNVWPEQVIEINHTYSTAMDVLTQSGLDYLIADNYYMKNALVKRDSSSNLPTLQIKDFSFSILILPPMFILSRSTSQKILDFAQAGGKIVVLGSLPTGSPDIGANDPVIQQQMNRLLNLSNVINLSSKRDKLNLLPQVIINLTDPQIKILSGELPLFTSHRQIGENHFYWLANNTSEAKYCSLSLREGEGLAEIWDCESGEIKPLSYTKSEKRKIISLYFKPYQAFWLVFDEEKEPYSVVEKMAKKFETISLTGPWILSFPESDTIQVSSARFQLTENHIVQEKFLSANFDDSGWMWQSMVGPVHLPDTWRAFLLFNPDPNSQRFYRCKFNLDAIPERGLINVNADNTVRFWVNGIPVHPGDFANSWSKADLHDIFPYLHKGENLIAVEVSNSAGYGWLIIQGSLQLVNGQTFQLLSDKNWKESKTAPYGWRDLNFDDSSWEFAQLASESVDSENKSRMKPPKKVIYSKQALYWRIGIPPATKELYLPDLSEKTKIWIDGKAVPQVQNRIQVPENSKILVLLTPPEEEGLSGPAQFYCEGSGAGQLGSWLRMGLRRFTGFVDYETDFFLPENDQNVQIDLGTVLHMAEVWINNIKIGERLWPPFLFESRKAVKGGKNSIKIRVGNLMANQMGLKDDLGQLRHWGWRGTPPDNCFDAGLIGPVKLIIDDK